MDDPFGCLRDVELGGLDLHKLNSEMVEKKFDELPRIDHCPSCGVLLVCLATEFCRECPKCHKLFECGEDYFQEVSSGRSEPTAYFKKVLQKWRIYEMFSPNLFSFLGNVIAKFRAETGRSVNYACFLHNYFEMLPSEVWPCKEEIMETISHHLPKSDATRQEAKKLFHEWRITI